MVYLYAMDIRKLPDPKEDPALLREVSGGRRKKVMEYVRADDRKRCLGAGILLAKILPLYGERPETVTRGPEGKLQAEKVQFNLSHSGDFVICAVGEKAVGCDIEKMGEEPEGVAKRFFHPKETAYLQKFQGQQRRERFYRLWTWKESYVKMTGEGMKLSLQAFEILPEGERIQVRRGGERRSCCMMEYDIPGYKVSVCAKEHAFSDCVKYVDPFAADCETR